MTNEKKLLSFKAILLLNIKMCFYCLIHLHLGPQIMIISISN